MFDHHVMFKLRDEKKDQLQPFVAMLKQLKQDVPTIREVKVVLNQRKGPKSFDIYYYAKFDDEAGFQAYMKHPKHIPVMKYVEEICSGIADIDAW